MIPSLPWWVYSIAANVAIIAIEYINHSAGGAATWGVVLRRTWHLIIVAQFGLFKAWSGAPTILTAWVVFYIGNCLARLTLARFLFDRQVADWPVTLVGVGLITLGALAVKYGSAGG